MFQKFIRTVFSIIHHPIVKGLNRTVNYIVKGVIKNDKNHVKENQNQFQRKTIHAQVQSATNTM